MAITLQTLNAGSTAAVVSSPTPVKIFPSAGTAITGKSALVKNISLTNITTTSATLTIEVKVAMRGASSTFVYCAPKALQIPPGAQVVIDNEFCLDVSGQGVTVCDVIQIEVTGAVHTNNKIEWVVNGLLRDI